MALVPYGDVLLDGSVNPPLLKPAQSINIYERNTTTHVSLFEDEAGVVPLAQPILTDAAGRYFFWVEPGSYDRKYGSRTEPFEAVTGGVSRFNFLGLWNASTNTPTLADGTGASGDMYVVSVAGSHDFGHGSIAFGVNDQVIYDGARWERWPVSEAAGPATLTYDGSGRLSSATTPAGVIDNITYDAQGRIDTIRDNGTTRTFTYDATTGALTGVS